MILSPVIVGRVTDILSVASGGYLADGLDNLPLTVIAEAPLNDTNFLRAGTIPPSDDLARREDLEFRDDLRACRRYWMARGSMALTRRSISGTTPLTSPTAQA